MYQQWDEDKDGMLSYSEMCATLKHFELNLTNEETFDLMMVLDRNHDGYIDKTEFDATFGVEWRNIMGAAEWLDSAIEKIAAQLLEKNDNSLKKAFQKHSKTKKRRMNLEEFKQMLVEQSTGVEYTHAEVRAIFNYIDVRDQEYITQRLFCKAFARKKNESKDTLIMQRILEIIGQYQGELRKEFQTIDVERSGTVTVEEFKAVLSAVNQYLPNNLSPMELSKLFASLDVDSYGFVLYEEFFSACLARGQTEASGS